MTAQIDLPLAVEVDVPNAASASRRKVFVSSTTGRLATKDDAGVITNYVDVADVSTVASDLASHEADTTNPHAVTAAQVDAPTNATFTAHTTDDTRHTPVGTDTGQLIYWDGSVWVTATESELSWDTSGAQNRLRANRITIEDSDDGDSRIHVTDDGQVQIGPHGGSTLGSYLLDIQGGAGDDELIRGRRDNALGGGFEIQAGNGDAGLYLTNGSYSRVSGGHIVVDHNNSDRVHIGSGDLDKNNSAIVVTDGNRVKLLNTTESTSSTTGAMEIAGGLGVLKRLNVGDFTTITSSNGDGALIGNNTGPTEHSVAEFRGDNGKRIRLRNKDNINYISWTGQTPFMMGENGGTYFDFRSGGGTSWTFGTTVWRVESADSTFTVNWKAAFNDTTASTSSTTGALTVAGGVGVGGALSVDGAISVAPDTDTNCDFGRVRIGSAFTDIAYFGHRDQFTTTGYAIAQDAAGETFINAKTGKSVNFRVNNATKVTFGTTLTTVHGVPVRIQDTTFATSSITGALTVAGGVGIAGELHMGAAIHGKQIRADSGYLHNGNQVVHNRKTGWALPTGTSDRTTFDTTTVTLEQLAQRVKALIEDLHATAGHGLIGT